MTYTPAYLAQLAKWQKQSAQKPDQNTRDKQGDYRNGAAQQFERNGYASLKK